MRRPAQIDYEHPPPLKATAWQASMSRKHEPGRVQYVDEDEQRRDITSQDVNEYLQEITGEDFTAKDFRTWAGTVLAAIALNAVGAFDTKRQAKANIKNAIGAVSKILGNTPAICRKCYVHPAVLETYLDGNSIEGLKKKTEEALEEEIVDLRSDEKAILKFLHDRLEKKQREPGGTSLSRPVATPLCDV
ncbi:MAG: topoisomerase [Verrucomicrobiota bacterium]|jgi:DNA topoisomerase-1